MSISKLTPLLAIVALCAFLITCSKESETPTGPEPQPGKIDLITVTPSFGPPGTSLTINGLRFDTARVASYTAFLDGEATPFRISGESLVQVAIPLFLDTALGWPSPPSDSVSLEILLDGKVVARTAKVILVDSLLHASGTTARIKSKIDTVLVDFQLLFSALPVHHSWEQEYRDSLLAVVGSLISGPDISLAAILDGSSSLLNGVSVDLELADALMVSTGADKYWQEYLSAFSSAGGKLRREIENKQAAGLLCPDLGPDMNLACSMQLYVMLHDWATEFLAETRSDWGSGMGWLFDIVSLYPPANAFPPVIVGKLIGSILTIADIMVNNAVLSLLPSHITSFDMTLASETMEVDQFTNSQFFITANNSPQQITLNEMVDFVFAAMGLQGTPAVQDVRMIVLNVVQFMIDKLRTLYSYLATIAPDVFQDPQLVDRNWFMFPNITWGPVEVTSHDLVELYSFTPDTLEADSAAYEWWSVNCGEGRIQARTRAAGERSRIIRDWLFCVGCQYSGGAFGEEIAFTETRTVTIGTDGSLEVVISGLPQGENADVIVIYPDGATFDYFSSTDTLVEIESGQFEVQANDVTASDGTVFIGKPKTQMADVTCDNTFTANIEYVEKYGSLLLTVSGLPGFENANITVTGPDNYTIEVTSDVLIDSLIEGEYTITAQDVTISGTGKTLTANPHSQTVSVIAGQTSTASVDYLGDLLVNVFYGNPGYIGSVNTSAGTNYIYDGIGDPANYITDGCNVVGFAPDGVTASGEQATEFEAGASSAILTIKQNGFSVMMSSIGSAHLPDRPNSPVESTAGSSNIYFGASGTQVYRSSGIALEIVNPSEDTVDINVSWSNSSSGSGSMPGQAILNIAARGPGDLCDLAPVTVLSTCQTNYQFQCVGDTIFTTTSSRSFMFFSTSTSAGGFVRAGSDPSNSNAEANLNLDVTARKR